MKTHSSGVPMFFGIYLVCLMLIGCLFLIKNDATRIRSAEMVVPELKDFTPVRKRIRLVQMNPIKKFAPAKLLRPSCTPNVFVAILPPAEKDGLASVAPKQIGAWRMLLDFGQTISAFSFPIIPENGWLTKQSKLKAEASFVNSDDQKFQSASFKPSIVLPKAEPVSIFEALEPNVVVANDFETKQLIQTEMGWLDQIGVATDTLALMQEELDNVWETAAYDSGDAEASLYRVLIEVHNLSLPDDSEAMAGNAEDLRVLDCAKVRINSAVYQWIEILNGDANTSLDSLQIPEIDFRKLNTALRSMFGNSWF